MVMSNPSDLGFRSEGRRRPPGTPSFRGFAEGGTTTAGLVAAAIWGTLEVVSREEKGTPVRLSLADRRGESRLRRRSEWLPSRRPMRARIVHDDNEPSLMESLRWPRLRSRAVRVSDSHNERIPASNELREIFRCRRIPGFDGGSIGLALCGDRDLVDGLGPSYCCEHGFSGRCRSSS